jgi:heat-inducible transcriptional repressor
MKRVSKRDFILKSIIQEYLKYGLPIGSSELQIKMNLDISPSTIRIYLKKLSDEGALNQLHVSSGRVPTYSALENYWNDVLDPKRSLEIKNLDFVETKVKEFGLFCKVEKRSKDLLKEVMSVQDRYIILVFDKNEIVLKYTEQVKRFLSNLVGVDIKELKKITAQVGLYELHDKIEQIFTSDYLLQEGESEVYEIAREYKNFQIIDLLLNTELISTLKEGVYFKEFVPKGCMAVKQMARIDEDDVSLFCFGRIQSNFGEFLEEMSKDR